MKPSKRASRVLSEEEAVALKNHEEVIARELRGFLEVGRALVAIRDNKLYRSEYKTFEQYCQKRWELARSTAYSMMAGSKISENLSAFANKSEPPEYFVEPWCEGQIRPLAVLADKPEKQAAAWIAACKRTEGKPTQATVKEEVNAIIRLPSKPIDHEKPNPEFDYIPKNFRVWWHSKAGPRQEHRRQAWNMLRKLVGKQIPPEFINAQ